VDPSAVPPAPVGRTPAVLLFGMHLDMHDKVMNIRNAHGMQACHDDGLGEAGNKSTKHDQELVIKKLIAHWVYAYFFSGRDANSTSCSTYTITCM